MKCPWCAREIGLPMPGRVAAQCPYCAGQVTYAFRGKTALVYLAVALPLAYVLLPLLGGIVIPLALALPFVGAAYLAKWY